MRKLLTAVTAALAITMLLVMSPAQAKEVVIKFSHVVAENTPKGQMANKFRDLVAERLAGKVEEAMLLGDVQLAAPSLSKFSRYTQKLQVYDLPFLFTDMAAVERFQQGPEGQKLLNSMKKKGLLGVGYLHNGMKQLSASAPLRVPADAKNLKFRIMTSDVIAAQFEAVDAVPLKKPFSEVFTLLQTRAIDGQENTWSNIYSKKFFEVQPYITESNHGVLDYMVVTSTEFWNSMPNDIRSEVEKALKEAIALGNRVAGEKAEEDKQKIIDSNRSEVINLTAAERAQWVEVMKPVWKQFEGEIGKDLIDAAYNANN